MTAEIDERRAAAGVAVDLGEDQAGDRDRGDERLGDRHGLLAGHRIDHEQGLDRLDRGVDRADLGHQGLVDREPAGGVEDHDVPDLALGGLDAAAGDVDDRRAGGRAVDGDVERLAEGLRAGPRRPVDTGRRRRAAAAGRA